MGKRGPSKTPTEILKLHGSKKLRERKDEPAAVEGRPDCPDWLADEAKAEWKRQIEDLEPRRLMAKSYRVALAMYCAAWGNYVEAYKAVEKQGPMTFTPEGCPIQNPMVGVRNKAFDAVMKLGQKFGFSPADKADVKAEAPPPEQGIRTRSRA